MKPKILIVEDEPAIAENIQYVFEGEGLDTVLATTGGAVPALMAANTIDLILLDIGLPDTTGLDVLRQIRRTRSTPIIFLTARNTEMDRVLGLEIGADDYVAKPFSPRELAARVKAVLRRAQQPSAAPSGPLTATVTTFAPFTIDPSRRQIAFRGSVLELSRTEYDILATFIRRPGHVFSRDQLMEQVWDQPESSLDRTVDVHIKNIRAKLRAVAPDADPIVTHRGTGYSLREDA